MPTPSKTELLSPLQDRLLLPVLIFAGFVVAIIGTLGAPMIPTIAREQGVSLEAAQWMLTITLLVGAIATPLNGRLADGQMRRKALLGTLTIVMIGAIISALSDTFAPFIAGRAMQGAGQAILPLTIASAREYLPRERMRSGIAILSVSTAAGLGIGYPLTGLVTKYGDYHAGFWFAAIVTAFAVLACYFIVPNSRETNKARLDLVGAALFSVGLLCVLLAISQGDQWGWTSSETLALIAVGAATIAVWVVYELRIPHPLVQLRLLTRRLVLAANVVVVLMGMALYMMSSLINRYVQTPVEANYGLHSSLLQTGLMLAPLSLGSIISSQVAARMSARIIPGRILAVGATITGLNMLYLALTRTYWWEIVLATLILGVGVGMTFSMMPGLIIRSVPADETGSATGMNQVLRLVGGAIGSAFSVSILAAHHETGTAYVSNQGYTIAFAVGAIFCFAAAVFSLVLIGKAGTQPAQIVSEVLAKDEGVAGTLAPGLDVSS